MRRIAILVLLAVGLAQPARAQAPTEADPPYMPQLTRLAEILGAVHFLQNLCGKSADRTVWRQDMAALLEAENPSPERRARLVAAFNRGYRGFAETYRSCTDSARVAIDRYRVEGSKIAREIVARYSG